jgi:peptide-methionine (R)-S-oxide reductase
MSPVSWQTGRDEQLRLLPEADDIRWRSRQFSPTPRDSTQTFEVSHTDAQWRQLLSPEQYDVLRNAGTETPFTSPLNDEHRTGVFACGGCALDLFSSSTKFGHLGHVFDDGPEPTGLRYCMDGVAMTFRAT